MCVGALESSSFCRNICIFLSLKTHLLSLFVVLDFARIIAIFGGFLRKVAIMSPFWKGILCTNFGDIFRRKNATRHTKSNEILWHKTRT